MAQSVNLNRPFDPRLFLTDQELDRGAGLLISGADELMRAAEKARKKAGLSKPELQILMAVRYRPDQTVSELRGSLGMTVIFLVAQGVYLSRHLHDDPSTSKPKD